MKKKIIKINTILREKSFLQSYESQFFNGPPENNRDFIMASALALKQGDWKKSVQMVVELPVWNLLPDGGVSDGCFFKTEGLFVEANSNLYAFVCF